MSELQKNIASLVKTGMTQEHLSGLSEMLQNITSAMESYGCILWQVRPGADLQKEPPAGQLFALAHWLQGDGVFKHHNLPLDSLTGMSVRQRVALKSDDVQSDSRIHLDQFLTNAGIRTMLVVPLEFVDLSEGAAKKAINGAINLYRTEERVFSEEEVKQAVELTRFVPLLYRAIRDRVSLSLVTSVNEVLQDERSATGQSSPELEKAILQKLCAQIGETFQSLETSIFLQDLATEPEKYKLMATTWTSHFRKAEYIPSREDGLTGWVLENAEPVKIFDLAAFEKERESIRQEYPGIIWRDSLDFRNSAQKKMNLKDEKDAPPLSFMAAPVLLGSKVLGAIRCCTSKRGPYYYADRELDLLKLVAAQLGQYWNNRQVYKNTIRLLQEAKTDLNNNLNELIELKNEQAQTFEDLEHQLKTPIFQSYQRVESLLKESALTDRVKSNLKAVKVLCGKAKRVAFSIGLFAKLERGEAIPTNKRTLEEGQLVAMLKTATADNQMIVAPIRNISFDLREKSLQVVRGIRVEVDADLIEQSINNLLDNAGKYGFRNTKVEISAGLTGRDSFFISVRNKGLPILSNQVREALTRGWRGGKAEASTGEGSGIGLWIVDNIMEAHNGRVEIIPTNSSGFTDVRLIFPCSRI